MAVAPLLWSDLQVCFCNGADTGCSSFDAAIEPFRAFQPLLLQSLSGLVLGLPILDASQPVHEMT